MATNYVLSNLIKCAAHFTSSDCTTFAPFSDSFLDEDLYLTKDEDNLAKFVPVTDLKISYIPGVFKFTTRKANEGEHVVTIREFFNAILEEAGCFDDIDYEADVVTNRNKFEETWDENGEYDLETYSIDEVVTRFFFEESEGHAELHVRF